MKVGSQAGNGENVIKSDQSSPVRVNPSKLRSAPLYFSPVCFDDNTWGGNPDFV